MAADSRCADGYAMHLTNCQKVFRLKNGALLGTAGDMDDREVRELLGRAAPRNLPSKTALAGTKTEFMGILVFPKGQVFLVNVGREEYQSEGEWVGSIIPITDEIIAVGHGQQFAYGVLEHGGSPIDAVRCACKRDMTCALPVQWAKLDDRSEGSGVEVAKRKPPQ